MKLLFYWYIVVWIILYYCFIVQKLCFTVPKYSWNLVFYCCLHCSLNYYLSSLFLCKDFVQICQYIDEFSFFSWLLQRRFNYWYFCAKNMFDFEYMYPWNLFVYWFPNCAYICIWNLVFYWFLNCCLNYFLSLLFFCKNCV